MKKVLNLIMVMLLIFSLVACNSKPATEDVSASDSTEKSDSIEKSDSSTGEEPKVLTDLFDGERKLWFCVNTKPDSLSYTTGVKAVFVTENKKVTELYYNIIPEFIAETLREAQTIPSNGASYTLEDFAGLSDDEILSMVKDRYGDASSSYQFYTEERNYSGMTGWTTNQNFDYQSCEFPCDIIYRGDLDNSGNNFERQDLKLFGGSSYSFSYQMDSMKANEISISSELKDCKIVKPTTIKDKEYVGIQETFWNTNSPNLIITQNTYESFGNIEYDDPAGSTKW